MNPRTLIIALLVPVVLALLTQQHPEVLDSLSNVIREALRKLNR